MSHRKELAVFAGVATALLISWRLSSHRPAEPRALPEPPRLPPLAVQGIRPGAPAAQSPVTNSRLSRFLSREAGNVGRTTDDPEAAERRLKEFAENLGADDFRELAARAVDVKAGGDERFLSAYLLGAAEAGDSLTAEAAQSAMISVATSEVPQYPADSPLRAMELTVRAEAMEGMARYAGDPGARSKVTELISQLKDPFLADRAHRVLYAMDHGGAGVVQRQDAAALQKLLQRH